MAMTVCPDGHPSDAADYCDTCGVAMVDPAPAPVAAVPQQSPTGVAGEAVGNCPNCDTPRMPGEAFCEVCGLDYATGNLPSAPSAPTAAPDPSANLPDGWVLAVQADRDWWTAQEAEAGREVPFPEDAAGSTHAVTSATTTIGRRSEGEGWYPAIDLGHSHDDPAVSRRHAEIRATGDGLALVDIGSTNGTRHNDEPVAADEPVALADGDVIHLGAFTRITVARSGGAA